MASSDYISREAALSAQNKSMNLAECRKRLESIPAADVLPSDEAIKMGAELAAMHGSDATSQQLEEAYLKGVEYGMTRRDARPVVRGKWEYNGPDENVPYCSNCMLPSDEETRFCAGCGADMRDT